MLVGGWHQAQAGPGDRWDLNLLASKELLLLLPPLLLLLLLLATLLLAAFSLLFLPLRPELHFSALLKLRWQGAS